jgi:hypothetical protein
MGVNYHINDFSGNKNEISLSILTRDKFLAFRSLEKLLHDYAIFCKDRAFSSELENVKEDEKSYFVAKKGILPDELIAKDYIGCPSKINDSAVGLVLKAELQNTRYDKSKIPEKIDFREARKGNYHFIKLSFENRTNPGQDIKAKEHFLEYIMTRKDVKYVRIGE